MGGRSDIFSMGIFDSVKKLLVVPDEDDLMDDEIYEEPPSRREKKTVQEKERIENLRPERKVYRRNQESEEAPEPVRERRIERNNKIVPIRKTSNGGEVCIMKISSFDEAPDVSDLLLEGKAVVVNLEGIDVEVAQRVMDFISGSVYTMQGNIHGVSQYIFILSPNGVDISGDYIDVVDRFDVPNIIKDF